MKDFFRDTTQRKERAFYTVLPGKKNNTGRESIYPRVGRRAGLYLYSDRAVREQRTFLWEVPEIQADVFCVPHQPGKQN